MEYNDFQDYIDTNADIADIKALPLMHNAMETDYTNHIMADGILPQPCDVFIGNDLSYFFYGRPMYIPKPKPDLRENHYYVPVCIGINPEAISYYAVTPTDTGAYNKRDDIKAHFGGIPIDRYNMTATLENIRCYIKTFWGTNYNYMHGECKYQMSPECSDVVLVKMLEVLNGTIEFDGIDNRIKAVEIRTKEACSLDAATQVLIVPSDLFAESLAKFPNAMVIPYVATAGLVNEQMQNIVEIERAIIEYMINHGMIRSPEEQAS